MPLSRKSRATLLAKLRELNIRYEETTWKNFTEDQINPGAIVVEVDTKQQIIQLVNIINQLNRQQEATNLINIRAVAGWSDSGQTQCCSCLPWTFKRHHTEKYNESFSFSPVTQGDILVRFSPKYHKVKVLGELGKPPFYNPENPIHNLKAREVYVSAGVQLKQLIKSLTHHRVHKLSLPTASMISYVTPVGLSATGGHGTGRDEPSFAGLITEIEVVTMDGRLKSIRSDDKDFAQLAGAHCGMLGIITGIKLRAVERFNLKETIQNFSRIEDFNAQAIAPLMHENQYFTMMYIPQYGHKPVLGKALDNIQVRMWNYTTQKANPKKKPPFDAGIDAFTQELTTKMGTSVLDLLIDQQLHDLIPYYMQFAASFVIGGRGTAPKVNPEEYITHYQTAFPKQIRDVSFLIPVDDESAPELLSRLMQTFDAYLEKSPTNDEYPVLYTVYARYFKGTNGGLSTSHTANEQQRILAIEPATHPDAPGYEKLIQALLDTFDSLGIQARYHLGKDMPRDVINYEQFLGQEAIEQTREALGRWYGSREALDNSPFISPYFRQMLLPAKSLQKTLSPHQVSSIKDEPHPLNDEQCLQELNSFVSTLESFKTHDETQAYTKAQLIEQCNRHIQSLEMRLTSDPLVASGY